MGEEIDVKRLFVIFAAIVAVGGCGGSVCDDLIEKQKACCDDVADKEACLDQVDALNLGNTDNASCEAAAAAFTCAPQ